MLQNMSTDDVEETIISHMCANCGKEGSDITNTCNKCKMVMYCNAACKKKHRHKHKKQCEKRVAELRDEALFKQPPPQDEDCPICFLRMPTLRTGSTYMSCCGKFICSGCFYANANIDLAKQLCAFCRTPASKLDDVIIKRMYKRAEAGDAHAFFRLGHYHNQGLKGLQQDRALALDLWNQAADLGNAKAYFNIGIAYHTGNGVEMDEQKGERYFELAAMRGVDLARHNLGCTEEELGNVQRAMKHWMIAVESGSKKSLDRVQMLFVNGHATKDDYSKALRAYQSYLEEIRSDQRDKAAAASVRFKYIT